jgi:hypothetical protein
MASPRNFLAALLMLCCASPALSQFCANNCPTGCTDQVCIVTTEAELRHALCCLECNNCVSCNDPDDCPISTGACHHIRIPAGTTLDIGNTTVDINCHHRGLHLEIQGPANGQPAAVVRFVGTSTCPDCKIFNLNGCGKVTIDGGGKITSQYIASEDGPRVRAFQLQGGCRNVVIQNLDIGEVGYGVLVKSGGAASVTLRNLNIRNTRDYGIYSAERVTCVIEDCAFRKSYLQHGYRFYSSEVTVKNCWAYEAHSTGLWAVQGDVINVDGFASDKFIAFGPNKDAGSPDDRLTHVNVQRLATAEHVRVEMGTIGGCFVDLCIPELQVGRPLSAFPTPALNRPLDYVNWDAISGTVLVTSQADNPLMGNHVQSVNYNYCFEDIDKDGVVDIDDLLNVLMHWGACPSPPSGISGPYPPCFADVDPHVCGNNVVNIDDLLQILLQWGGCPATPACGETPATIGGIAESPPQTIDDCWGKCSANYPDDEAGWIECFNGCVEALRRAGLVGE